MARSWTSSKIPRTAAASRAIAGRCRSIDLFGSRRRPVSGGGSSSRNAPRARIASGFGEIDGMTAIACIALLTALASTSGQPASTQQGTGFLDVAAQAGLPGGIAPRTQLIDVNGDGWLDVVMFAPQFRILLS